MKDQTKKIIIALVGMAGSGKSEVAPLLSPKGESVPIIRFGDITDEVLTHQGLAITPENEATVRENLRQQQGMAIYAVMSLPKIRVALEVHDLVIVDGMYSMSEYKRLRQEFGDQLVTVAVFTNRMLRYARLAKRAVRPLNREQAEARDLAEIDNLEKGGPIAIADYTILNNGDRFDLMLEIRKLKEQIALESKSNIGTAVFHSWKPEVGQQVLVTPCDGRPEFVGTVTQKPSSDASPKWSGQTSAHQDGALTEPKRPYYVVVDQNGDHEDYELDELRPVES
jgi:Dephospho-CoA kinase